MLFSGFFDDLLGRYPRFQVVRANPSPLGTACKTAADDIGNTLARTMAEKAAKNIEGYSFREAMKSLFS